MMQSYEAAIAAQDKLPYMEPPFIITRSGRSTAPRSASEQSQRSRSRFPSRFAPDAAQWLEPLRPLAKPRSAGQQDTGRPHGTSLKGSVEICGSSHPVSDLWIAIEALLLEGRALSRPCLVDCAKPNRNRPGTRPTRRSSLQRAAKAQRRSTAKILCRRAAARFE